MPSSSIRRALAHEAPALSALAFASKGYWPYPRAQLETWRAGLTISAYTAAFGHVWLTEVAGEIAAFFVLVPGQRDWMLEHFWVHPSHLRRGIGRRMLEAAAALVARAGGAGLIIHSDPYAEPFYAACGATRVGSQPAPIDGEPARVLPVMRLALP